MKSNFPRYKALPNPNTKKIKLKKFAIKFFKYLQFLTKFLLATKYFIEPMVLFSNKQRHFSPYNYCQK